MTFTLSETDSVIAGGARWTLTRVPGGSLDMGWFYTLTRAPIAGVNGGRRGQEYVHVDLVSSVNLTTTTPASRPPPPDRLEGREWKLAHAYGTVLMCRTITMGPLDLSGGDAKLIVEILDPEEIDLDTAFHSVADGGNARKLIEYWLDEETGRKVFINDAYKKDWEEKNMPSKPKPHCFNELFEWEIFAKDDNTDVEIKFLTRKPGDESSGDQDDEIQTKVFHCHANVLSRLSPVWKRELTSDMEEGRAKVIDASDPLFTVGQLEPFLRAVYDSKTLENLGVESLCAVYRLADKYDVQRLIALIRPMLQNEEIEAALKGPGAVCAAIDLAYIFDLKDLLKLCFDEFPRVLTEGNENGAGAGGVSFCESRPWKALVAKYPHLPVTLEAMGKMK